MSEYEIKAASVGPNCEKEPYEEVSVETGTGSITEFETTKRGLKPRHAQVCRMDLG